MSRFFTAFANNRILANMCFLLLILSGCAGLTQLVREVMPTIPENEITIRIDYPGADPEEVEEGVSIKIEEALEGVEGVKKIITRSLEGQGSALVIVKEGHSLSEVRDRVQTEINAVSTFPAGAERPLIQCEVIQDPVLTLYLAGSTTEHRMKVWAEILKADLLSLPQVSRVRLTGTREAEIAVEVSEATLRSYDLTLDGVAEAIRRSNLNLAGGTVRNSDREVRIRTIGRRYTGRELGPIIVKAQPDGGVLTLNQIAEIHDGFAEDPLRVEVDGKQAVLLHVFKSKEDDALMISKAVHEFVERKQKELSGLLELGVFVDYTEGLRNQTALMIKNGLFGVAVVFILLLLFLETRSAVWTGMGVPVSIAGGIALLWLSGGSLNMITLFGFIMVLGIVVDDAIVVNEAVHTHRGMGKDLLRSITDGLQEVGAPVLIAVGTTIIAFVPLYFVQGVLGQYIAIFPIVVIGCLAASLFDCLFILPAHLNHERHSGTRGLRFRIVPIPFGDLLSRVRTAVSRGLDRFVEGLYVPFLRKALGRSWLTVSCAIGLMMLVIGLVQGRLVRLDVMPEMDATILTGKVEFPDGTPSRVTRTAVSSIRAAVERVGRRTETLSGEPLIQRTLCVVGQSIDEEFGESDEPTRPAIGAVQVILLESKKRGISAKEILLDWQEEVGGIPGARVLRFDAVTEGPPGDTLEIMLRGSRMETLLAASSELKRRLRRMEGVYQVSCDHVRGKSELRVALKPEARHFGLDVERLARQLYGGFYGEEAVRLQRGKDDVKVKVRYPAEERSRISHLRDLFVTASDGNRIPLSTVAEIHRAEGLSTITRKDGKRCLVVSAALDESRIQTKEVLHGLESSFFSRLKQRYPGVEWVAQGMEETEDEAFGSLFVGFPLAMGLIYMVVAGFLRSYTQPLVILITVPFGIIGAILGHFALRHPLSLFSIFGMVALAGVVVNDAIVLIHRLNKNLEKGMPFRDALTRAARRRFRAVFLTSISTVGGLAPLILEKSLEAQWLIPMAVSIAAGVTFATALTLILIPCLLSVFHDLRKACVEKT